jgi:hypothetical protein
MDELRLTCDRYLHEVAARLGGSRRTKKRLLTELRDHFDDAVAANRVDGVHPARAEELAVESLGPPAVLATAWRARSARLRWRRRRTGLLIAAIASASILAAAQHADGRSPSHPVVRCAAVQNAHVNGPCARPDAPR